MRVPTTVPFFGVRDIYMVKCNIKTMGKYLKKFGTHAEYETYSGGWEMALPNVSYCVNENEVHYNPWTWAEEYLTTVALEDGTISFNISQSMGTDTITSISYSTDGGETWTTTNNANNKEENLVIDVDVEEGDKVMWKGIATQTGYYDVAEDATYSSFFSSDCEFDAQGNVMSLLYGDDFKGETTIGDYAFCSLFYDYNEVKNCNIVNANNLSLPATTLAENCYNAMFFGCTSLTTAPDLPATTLAKGCYGGMFGGCTSLTATPELPVTTLAEDCYGYMFGDCASLTTAPELPATTLASFCYRSMFQNCASLTTAPELPATTLADGCYSSMFQNCTSLTTAPELPATTLAESCYEYMFGGCTSLITAPELPATTLAESCYWGLFRGCTNLVNAPELPATTLAESCYEYMFQDCTSLITAPELPATTMAEYCYQFMFNGCTSLVNAPELPATTLASQCYNGMFYGCTSLTTAPDLPVTTLAKGCYGGMFGGCTNLVNAPELPATALVEYCYTSMFSGCTNLNYIKAMFTTTPGTSYTNSWVSGVAANGTFVKNSAATWNVSGVNGIPTGWTVQTASA